MITLGPDSVCDVCWEPFDGTEKIPHAVGCGHVFCLPCLRALSPPTCPLCRTAYRQSAMIKLHVDHKTEAEAEADASPPTSARSGTSGNRGNAGSGAEPVPLRARQLREIIARVVNGEFETEEFDLDTLEEIREWLLWNEQSAQYDDLRSSLLLLGRLADLHGTCSDLAQRVPDLEARCTTLTEQRDAAQARLEEFTEDQGEDATLAQTILRSLQEHADAVEREWKTKYDQKSDDYDRQAAEFGDYKARHEEAINALADERERHHVATRTQQREHQALAAASRRLEDEVRRLTASNAAKDLSLSREKRMISQLQGMDHDWRRRYDAIFAEHQALSVELQRLKLEELSPTPQPLHSPPTPNSPITPTSGRFTEPHIVPPMPNGGAGPSSPRSPHILSPFPHPVFAPPPPGARAPTPPEFHLAASYVKDIKAGISAPPLFGGPAPGLAPRRASNNPFLDLPAAQLKPLPTMPGEFSPYASTGGGGGGAGLPPSLTPGRRPLRDEREPAPRHSRAMSAAELEAAELREMGIYEMRPGAYVQIMDDIAARPRSFAPASQTWPHSHLKSSSTSSIPMMRAPSTPQAPAPQGETSFLARMRHPFAALASRSRPSSMDVSSLPTETKRSQVQAPTSPLADHTLSQQMSRAPR